MNIAEFNELTGQEKLSFLRTASEEDKRMLQEAGFEALLSNDTEKEKEDGK